MERGCRPQHADMDQNLSQDDALIQEFLVESSELVEQVVQELVVLEAAPADPETLNRIFRALHTIKGTSGFLGFDESRSAGKHLERTLDVMNKLSLKMKLGVGFGILLVMIQDRLLIVIDPSLLFDDGECAAFATASA